CLVLLFACFFFSSRRRHTRSKRDWSSDVCSSDLAVALEIALRIVELRLVARELTQRLVELRLERPGVDLRQQIAFRHDLAFKKRSEERRVGKECRSRWWW